MTSMLSTAAEGKKSEEDPVWGKTTGFLALGRLNDAYSLALSKKDPFLLVRLMGKTGIVLDKLDNSVIENVVGKIAELLDSGEFVELLLGWIVALVDRKIFISTPVRNLITNSLENLCEDEGKKGRLDEMQLSEANRAYNILKAGY